MIRSHREFIFVVSSLNFRMPQNSYLGSVSVSVRNNKLSTVVKTRSYYVAPVRMKNIFFFTHTAVPVSSDGLFFTSLCVQPL